MFLRGIDFGYCLDQSGVRGFFGEGYPYHRYLKPIGLRFLGSTFVSKTTTLNPQKGRMRLKEDRVTPADFMPDCIVVDFLSGYAINAIGLSGPGAEFLLAQGRWQALADPFFISFMSIAETKRQRLAELFEFVALLKNRKKEFRAKFGLQINFSCPNVDVHLAGREMEDEVLGGLEIAAGLGVPLMPKINIETEVGTALAIARHPQCDALCVSNTVKWGNLPDKIDWMKLFNKDGKSPLAHMGGGGLSGKPLFPVVCEWLTKARQAGFHKPLNVGGGVLGPRDAARLIELRASSIALGSMAFLRPHRMQRTISRINELARTGQFYEPTH